MSAYRRLLSNTFLFSVSTFGSKILTFLLTPFYTSILSDAEYGVTDLIIQTGNFLIPLASIGVVNAALRPKSTSAKAPRPGRCGRNWRG